MKAELSPAARESVRDGVRQVLRLVGDELGVSEESVGRPGDAGEVYDHIDALVRIARRTTGDDPKPYLAQLPAEVCAGCRHQFETGFCPLRHRSLCVLQVATTPVFEAIGGVLRNLGDAEYCQAHDAEAAAAPADDRCNPSCGCEGCAESGFFG
jgi:hypothetical protein